MRNEKLFSVLLFFASTILALAVAEGILRLKNSSMTNYDIEMWRYSKELKFQSDNPILGHDHLKNEAAVLQSVPIRTNEWGLRGGPVAKRDPAVRRILFLGASITLGWGVAESDTLTERLGKAFAAKGERVEVLNAGIGNYNAERYVERFMKQLTELQPSDIVVHYFLRDAEKLDAGRNNFILRNSQLAVTLWIAAGRLLNKSGESTLLEHYRSVYDESQPGYQAMLAALTRLADYAKSKNIKITLAMTPDVHNLAKYEFGFVHDRMRQVAQKLGYAYVDQLPAFGALDAKQVWAMPGDPHPNALGHELMAKALFPVLSGERP